MKLKSIIGIVLIIISLAAMYMWETVYRDRLLMTEVLVAAKDIESGECITPDSFKVMSVAKDSLVKAYVIPEDAQRYFDQICVFPFRENAQITADAFVSKDALVTEGSYTVFISGDWIFQKNAELRVGDMVSIYIMPDKTYVGTYQVKYLDMEDNEFVEVQCPLSEYFSMLDAIRENKENSLLLLSERSL